MAYKSITVPVKIGSETVDLKIPFTVELLEQVEEVLFGLQGVGFKWFRIKPSDNTVRTVYESFCKKYLPDDFDFQAVQPTFCALFFSAVRKELLHSIQDFENLTLSTEKQ